MQLDDVDLLDFDRFQRGEHHEMFRALRNTGNGIHWIDEPDGPGFWAITRIDQLREVNREPEVFSSTKGGTQIQDAAPDDFEAHLQNAGIAEHGATTAAKPTETRRRGYKVKRSFVELSPEDEKAREQAAIKTIAERLRRPPPASDP